MMPLKKAARADLLFWAIAVALLFFRLGDTSAWGSEDRWLEIAREMTTSGNYFSPTINGVVYFDKPLVSYWLLIAAAKLGGGIDEFSLRAPSALSALLALWATIDLGSRLWSRPAGRLAGWILLTSLGFLQWGRVGEADMENLAACIVAVCWYWRHRERPSFAGYAGFYLILAIGAQCKGLGAVAVPLLAVLADLLLDRNRLRTHIDMRHAAAIALGIAVYFVPFLLATGGHAPQTSTATAATQETGLGLVLRENIVRYFAPFDHDDPPWTYLVSIPQYFFPWSAVLVCALVAAVRTRLRGDSHARWVVLAFALIFAFFTISGSRRNYYILPVLPYCALIASHFLLGEAYPRLRQWSLRISVGLLALVGVLQLAILPAWPLLQRRFGADLPRDIAWACLAAGLVALASILYVHIRRRQIARAAIAAVIVPAIVLWSGYFFWQQIIRDRLRTEAEFALRLAPIAAALPRADASTIAIYDARPAGRLLFYANLPTPISQPRNADEMQRFIDTPPYPKLLLVHEKQRHEVPLPLRERQPDLAERRYSWEKRDDSKLLLWRIDSAPTR